LNELPEIALKKGEGVLLYAGSNPSIQPNAGEGR